MPLFRISRRRPAFGFVFSTLCSIKYWVELYPFVIPAKARIQASRVELCGQPNNRNPAIGFVLSNNATGTANTNYPNVGNSPVH